MESIVKKLGRINAEMLLQAAKVASVVGTVLLLINQWPALFEGQPLRVLAGCADLLRAVLRVFIRQAQRRRLS